MDVNFLSVWAEPKLHLFILKVLYGCLKMSVRFISHSKGFINTLTRSSWV